MKVSWPFGVALREEASNRPPGPWLKTVVLSGVGKGALDVSGRDQEGERKRIADEVSKNIRVTSKRVQRMPREGDW
jgi:hypothetical protein